MQNLFCRAETKPKMASIELKNIHKRWGQFIAVDDFNLTIADNEFLVLLGPSGWKNNYYANDCRARGC